MFKFSRLEGIIIIHDIKTLKQHKDGQRMNQSKCSKENKDKDNSLYNLWNENFIA